MVDEVKKTGSLDRIKSKKYDDFKTKFEAMAEDKKSIFMHDADKNGDGKVSKHELKKAASAFMVEEAQRKPAEVVKAKAPEVKPAPVEEPCVDEVVKETPKPPVEECKDEAPPAAPVKTEVKPEPKPEPKRPTFKVEYSDAEPGTVDDKGIYTVKEHDSLYKIVKEQLPSKDPTEIMNVVDKLYKSNLDKKLVGEKSKGEIYAGQKLDISEILGDKKAPKAEPKADPKAAGTTLPAAKFKNEIKTIDGSKVLVEPDPVTGKPLKETILHDDMKVSNINKYDPKTNLIASKIEYYEDGRTVSYETTYKNGVKAQNIDYAEDGSINYKEDFKYDANHKLTSSVQRNPKGKVLKESTYFHGAEVLSKYIDNVKEDGSREIYERLDAKNVNFDKKTVIAKDGTVTKYKRDANAKWAEVK